MLWPCPSCDRETQVNEEAGGALPTDIAAPPAAEDDRLFSPDVLERYVELSRRPRGAECDYCGAEPTEGGNKLKLCSTCRRKAYCSAACQQKDWKEGGHKASCRPKKDFRKDDVVVAEGVESQPELIGQLMVVVGPALASDDHWLVLDAERKSISMHADKLRLVVPVEEREGTVKSMEMMAGRALGEECCIS